MSTTYKILFNILLSTISVDSDVTGQPMITYSAFVKYLRKSGNVMGQYISYLQKAYDSVKMEVLCNTFIEFCMPMKIARLIKMRLN